MTRTGGDAAHESDPVKRRRLAVAVWVGVGAMWAWFIFRLWRGAVNTATGDFNDFYFAAEAMRAGADIYASGRGGYLYPPLVAWLLQPLAPLGLVKGALVWGALNVALTLVCLTLSLRVAARALRGPRDALTIGAVWLLAMALTLGPIQSELEHGQTDGIVLLGLCAALALLDRAPSLAGLALGLALLVKHHVVVVLAYVLVRRRWRVGAAAAAGGAIFAFLPALQLGLPATGAALARSYGYLFRLFGGEGAPEGVNLHPITWELSISITSAAARLLDGPGGPPTALVGAATAPVAAAVFLATWLIYRRYGVPMFSGRGPATDRTREAVVLLEWCGVIIGLLAFSPQSITRHTYIMLPAHVLAAYVLLVKRPGAVKWPLLAGVVGYQLAARLPPGEDAFRKALEAWRYVSGATWFMLGMWLTLAWSTLSFARAGVTTLPEQASPPGTR
ncbi:MAG TPA: glycosyltransferase 87 family protein [Phycisphaerales bacterium]|nr:glycosyltransferase 87 family protein [Phycisphaerales bacterium]